MVLFAPGDAYTVGCRSSHENTSITEFVPTGQTVLNWMDMYTVQVFLHASEDAPAFLQRLGKKFSDACPGTTVGNGGVIASAVNGYPVSMLGDVLSAQSRHRQARDHGLSRDQGQGFPVLGTARLAHGQRPVSN